MHKCLQTHSIDLVITVVECTRGLALYCFNYVITFINMSLNMNSITKTETWLNSYNELGQQKTDFKIGKKCLTGWPGLRNYMSFDSIYCFCNIYVNHLAYYNTVDNHTMKDTKTKWKNNSGYKVSFN